MVLGDAVSKVETFVWILNHISRFIAWSLHHTWQPRSQGLSSYRLASKMRDPENEVAYLVK